MKYEMTQNMKLSLGEMAEALQKLYRTLDTEIEQMAKNGLPSAKIEHVRAGTRAIRDCGNMLLVWTDYIARADLADPSADLESYDPHPR